MRQARIVLLVALLTGKISPSFTSETQGNESLDPAKLDEKNKLIAAWCTPHDDLPAIPEGYEHECTSHDDCVRKNGVRSACRKHDHNVCDDAFEGDWPHLKFVCPTNNQGLKIEIPRGGNHARRMKTKAQGHVQPDKKKDNKKDNGQDTVLRAGQDTAGTDPAKLGLSFIYLEHVDPTTGARCDTDAKPGVYVSDCTSNDSCFTNDGTFKCCKQHVGQRKCDSVIPGMQEYPAEGTPCLCGIPSGFDSSIVDVFRASTASSTDPTVDISSARGSDPTPVVPPISAPTQSPEPSSMPSQSPMPSEQPSDALCEGDVCTYLERVDSNKGNCDTAIKTVLTSRCTSNEDCFQNDGTFKCCKQHTSARVCDSILPGKALIPAQGVPCLCDIPSGL